MRKFVKAFAILSAVLMLASCGSFLTRKPVNNAPAGSLKVALPWARDAGGTTSSTTSDDSPFATSEDVGQYVVVVSNMGHTYLKTVIIDRENMDEYVDFTDLEEGDYCVAIYAILDTSDSQYGEHKARLNNGYSYALNPGQSFCGPVCARGEQLNIHVTASEDPNAAPTEVTVNLDLVYDCVYVADVDDANLYRGSRFGKIKADSENRFIGVEFANILSLDDSYNPCIREDDDGALCFFQPNGPKYYFMGWTVNEKLPVLTEENYEGYTERFDDILIENDAFEPTGHTTFYAVWCSDDTAYLNVHAAIVTSHLQ